MTLEQLRHMIMGMPEDAFENYVKDRLSHMKAASYRERLRDEIAELKATIAFRDMEIKKLREELEATIALQDMEIKKFRDEMWASVPIRGLSKTVRSWKVCCDGRNRDVVDEG